MPIWWRYLIYNFVSYTLGCVSAFIFLLLTMRLEEIAHFTALGAPFSYVILFIFYQIPYILPIALPLSCLIAALLITQRLSERFELTALRAAGWSLRAIFAPLWIFALFLSLGNFWIISELATQSHLNVNLLKNETRSLNPLLLLNNRHLMRLKGFHYEILGASRVGESATASVLAVPNTQQHRLSLFIFEELKLSPSFFHGKGMTFISGTPGEKEEDFDQLLIENISDSLTALPDFSSFLRAKTWLIHSDYLHMPFLISRIREQRKGLEIALQNEEYSTIQTLKKELNRSFSEISKRFSLAFAVLSFTFMGTAFGISISRKKHSLMLYFTIGLTALYLICFFIAKSVDHHFWLSTSLYIVPHIFILSLSFLFLRRITKGQEV
jgi:lipopolysaccharide export system permease protein